MSLICKRFQVIRVTNKQLLVDKLRRFKLKSRKPVITNLLKNDEVTSSILYFLLINIDLEINIQML